MALGTVIDWPNRAANISMTGKPSPGFQSEWFYVAVTVIDCVHSSTVTTTV